MSWTGVIFVLGMCGAAYLTRGPHVAAWCFVGWCAFSFLYRLARSVP